MNNKVLHPIYLEETEINSFFQRKKGRVIGFIDVNVYQFFKEYLDARFDLLLIISSGEKSKSMHQVEECIAFLMNHEVDKCDLLVGVGGGVVTDLTGYVSSIYKRGIDLALMPTTLLSMVDASIGGKNGINFGAVKNMIGTIKMPQAVLIEVRFLNSLPDIEWKNGFAEIIKHGFIEQFSLIQWLKEHHLERFQKDLSLTASLVLEAVNIKMKVVEEDPYEQGRRKILNFGHTFGHAFESILEIPHGQAVMLGMYWEQVFVNQYKKDEAKVDILKDMELLATLYYPIDFKFQYWNLMMPQINHDKKRVEGHLSLPFLKEIGHSALINIPLDDLEQFFVHLSLNA